MTARDASATRTLTVSDGETLAWRDIGGADATRVPAALIHGFGSNHALNWRGAGWGGRNGGARRLLALDLRGHGASTRPRGVGAYALERLARDVGEWLDTLALAPAAAVGYSLGAMTALTLLTQSPTRLRAAALCGIGGALFRSEARAKRGARIAAALRAEDAPAEADAESALYRRFVAAHNPPEARASLADAFEAAGNAVFRPEALAAIRTPTLVIAGERDVQAGSVDALADAIPGAERITLPRRDHMTAVGDPALREAVEDFLRRRADGGAEGAGGAPTSSTKG